MKINLDNMKINKLYLFKIEIVKYYPQNKIPLQNS